MLPVSSFSEEHPVGTPEPRALRDVVFVDGIPHTATGKILKTALRDQFKAYRFPNAAA